MRRFLFLGLIAGSAAGFAQSGPTAADAAHAPLVKATPPLQVAHLPLAFERNSQGSKDRYIARGQGYTIGLEDAKATIAYASGEARKAVSLEFAGAQPGTATPGPELPGKINVIRGNDPRKWQLGLSTYERVSWAGVYPGIDVVYYGNQQQLEYDFVVSPGADPRTIRMRFTGAERLELNAQGELEVYAGGAGVVTASRAAPLSECHQR